MPRYADPNLILAQQLGSGLSKLFAPTDNTRAMKYMVGASQVAQNRADIARLNAQAALDTQEAGYRGTLGNVDTAARAMGVPADSPLAQIVAAAMGIGTGTNDVMSGFNEGIGGQMVRTGDDDAARRGAASMGIAPGKDSAFTSSELAKQFAHATEINDADNATRRYGYDQSAAASRYGSDRSYAASVYDTDHKLFNVGKDSTLVDRNGNPVAHGSGTGAGIDIKPSDAAALSREIVAAMPAGAQLDGQDIASATALAAQRMSQNGGNAAEAISDVVRLFAVTPGVPNEDDPTKFDVAPTATATQAVRAGVVPRIIEPSNPASMRAAPPASLPPGARLAPDGHYYVQLPNGKYARVEF